MFPANQAIGVLVPAMPRSRMVRGGWWLTMVAAVVAAAAGCTSSGSPKPSPSASQQRSFARYPTAASLLTQCAITHGVTALQRSAQQYNASQPKQQVWLVGSTVDLTGANGGAFTDWYENAGGTVVVGGRQFGAWPMWAANHDQLPAQVCGTTIKAPAVRKVYAQVYAHWPAALRSDPW